MKTASGPALWCPNVANTITIIAILYYCYYSYIMYTYIHIYRLTFISPFSFLLPPKAEAKRGMQRRRNNRKCKRGRLQYNAVMTLSSFSTITVITVPLSESCNSLHNSHQIPINPRSLGALRILQFPPDLPSDSNESQQRLSHQISISPTK